MSEIDYGAVFDVSAAADGGVNEQEVAEPATDDALTGVNEQADAEPAGDTDTTMTTTEQTEVDSVNSECDDTSENVQSAAENSRYAAARRAAERERDLAIERARAQAQQEVDQAIAEMGLIDPYTGNQITTKADFDAYKASRSSEQVEQELEQAGISKDTLEQVIENHPAVRFAKDAGKKLAFQEARAAQAEAQAKIAEQIKALSQLDPTITNFTDLQKMDNFDQFYQLVVHNKLDFVQAYKLANVDKLAERKAAAARQQALNNSQSKEHLAPTVGRGTGAEPVDEETIKAYRIWNPEATVEEIQQYHNRSRKH